MLDARLLARQPAYYALTISLTLLGWLAVLGVLGASPHAPAVVVFTAVGSGFLTMQLAFIAHDLAHNEVFRSAAANRRLGLLVANLFIGSSVRWWADSHNRHHAQPNLMDVDPETVTLLWAFSAGQAASRSPLVRKCLRWQHLTIVGAMLFAGVGLVAASTHFIRAGGERAGGIALMVLHWLFVPALLVWLSGPLTGLIWLVIQQMVFGSYLTVASATNHMGMPEAGDVPDDFLRNQVLTARNVAGGVLMDFLCGGLNHQIEHHLFPSMPRNRLRAAQRLVRPFCDARAIHYHEATFVGALLEGYGDLVAVARGVSLAGA
ncbi:MAG: fatty acid desaturase family protein [Chloroflexota bacterium]